MDMRTYIKERCDLAHTYAEDGAYRSAARILQECATTVQQHADRVRQLEGSQRGRGKSVFPAVVKAFTTHREELVKQGEPKITNDRVFIDEASAIAGPTIDKLIELGQLAGYTMAAAKNPDYKPTDWFRESETKFKRMDNTRHVSCAARLNKWYITTRTSTGHDIALRGTTGRVRYWKTAEAAMNYADKINH